MSERISIAKDLTLYAELKDRIAELEAADDALLLAVEEIRQLKAQIEAVKEVRDTLMEYSLPEDDPEDPDLELAENVVKDLNQALKNSGGG